jgi:hypothetical protein
VVLEKENRVRGGKDGGETLAEGAYVREWVKKSAVS